MYKYIIYCSISTVIILATKYIYQNWLKIKNLISDLSSQVIFLQNKVKTLESELEKRTISGGAKIPIEFKPIEKKTNKKNITIAEENEFIEDNSENNDITNEKNEEILDTASEKSSPISLEKTEEIENALEVQDISQSSPEENEILSQASNNSVKNTDLDDITIEKKKKKKKNIPDAKNYNAGDKIELDGITHICVVGKRGGRSWKKIC